MVEARECLGDKRLRGCRPVVELYAGVWFLGFAKLSTH